MDERLIALDACVSDLRDEMVGFTSDLMEVASENPPGAGYRECVRIIKSRLRVLVCPMNLFRTGPPRVSATGPAPESC